VIYGLKEEQQENEKVVSSYNNLITVIANRTIHPEDMEQFLRYAVSTNLLQEFEYGKSEIAMEYRILTEDGEYTWVKSITNLVRSLETGDLIAYVCIRDIDTEKRRELELQRMAERDSLTGLYNREITCKLVDEHISGLHKSSNSALFMIDVDDFKEINDQFGHFYGDVVLCELGDKLRDIFGPDDIIGRVGGDEYIVYIKNDVSIKIIHEKAEAIVKAFSMVYKGLQGDEYAISGSVGVAIFPKDGKNFDELYQYADEALYQAKNNGKSMYQLYDGSDFEGLVSDRKTDQIDRAISAKNFQEHKSEYVFKILYQSENAIAAIYSVLELVTSHFSFERGYIFETSEDGKTTSNTFEWCAPGVRPEIDHLQNVPIEAAATANANFYKSGIYVVKSLKNLPDLEREVLEPQNIKSMIQFGIFDKYKLIGFIGFDNCSNEILLGNQESGEIETICNILAIFFVKHRMEEILEKDLKVWRDMINKLNEYVYVVNPVNFEILFMNDQTCKMMKQTQTHTPCYL
ncbi:MAG: diguanylate cyclase, partial [Acetivibrio sp.]